MRSGKAPDLKGFNIEATWGRCGSRTEGVQAHAPVLEQYVYARLQNPDIFLDGHYCDHPV